MKELTQNKDRHTGGIERWDVKHAAARKSFELAFSGVYKYINKNKEENLVKLMNLAHKIAGKNFPQYFWDNANEVLGDPEQKWTQMIYNAHGQTSSKHCKTARIKHGI